MDGFFAGLGGAPRQQRWAQRQQRRQSEQHDNNNNNPVMDFFRNVTGQAGAAAAQLQEQFGGQFGGQFDQFMNNAAPNFQHFVDQAQAQAQAQQQQSTGPPAASANALRHLPTISVSPEDLVEPSNRECCICLEENNIGDKVVRLPCAHIFHHACITDWLSRHCTCPTCRFELETEDSNYEAGRRQRMSTRKPRYAKYELQRMSIRELINLLPARQRQLRSSSYWSDKSDLIEHLIKNEIVDLISTPPPVEFPNLACLRAMGVGQLKRTMNDTGVYFDPREVVEKEDMVQIFLNSGRIYLTESSEDGGTSNGSSYGHLPPSAEKQRQRSYSFQHDDTDDREGDNNNKNDSQQHHQQQQRVHRSSSISTTTSSVVVETVGENDEDANNSPSRVASSKADSPAGAAAANEREAWGSDRVMEETGYSDESTTTNQQQPEDAEAPPAVPPPATAATAATANEEKVEDDDDTEGEEEEQNDATTAGQQPTQDITGTDVDGDAIMEDFPDEAALPAPAASVASSETETELVDESDNRKRERDETTGDEQQQQQQQQQPQPANNPNQRLSISQLRKIASDRGIDLSDCLEKSEMVERVTSSSSSTRRRSASGVARSHSTGNNSADLELALDTIQGWSISQLKTCGKALDMDLSNCNNNRDEMIESLVRASRRDHRVVKVALSLKPLMSMSIKQLRLQAITSDVNVNDCLEKSEILERLAAAAAAQ